MVGVTILGTDEGCQLRCLMSNSPVIFNSIALQALSDMTLLLCAKAITARSGMVSLSYV